MRAASGMEIVGVLLCVAISDEACQQVRVKAEGDIAIVGTLTATRL